MSNLHLPRLLPRCCLLHYSHALKCPPFIQLDRPSRPHHQFIPRIQTEKRTTQPCRSNPSIRSTKTKEKANEQHTKISACMKSKSIKLRPSSGELAVHSRYPHARARERERDRQRQRERERQRQAQRYHPCPVVAAFSPSLYLCLSASPCPFEPCGKHPQPVSHIHTLPTVP